MAPTLLCGFPGSSLDGSIFISSLAFSLTKPIHPPQNAHRHENCAVASVLTDLVAAWSVLKASLSQLQQSKMNKPPEFDASFDLASGSSVSFPIPILRLEYSTEPIPDCSKRSCPWTRVRGGGALPRKHRDENANKNCEQRSASLHRRSVIWLDR